MEQIGWSLIDGNGIEVQSWGGALGMCAGVPNVISLPNGDHVHAPQPGLLQEWWLVERHAERGPSNIVWDGVKVVVSIPVMADDIRKEAQRRIIALTGASSFDGCIVKQLNALMRATELSNKKAIGGTLTEVEETEASALQSLADQIKHIRACSNAMEAAPPTDYANDTHWST